MCWPRMVRTTGDELVSSEVTVEIFEWSIGAMCCCSILLINHTIRDGLPQNFYQGATSTFCLSFSGCWRYNANERSQNALPILHHNENVPCYANRHKNTLLGSISQVYYDNLHNSQSADFPNRVLFKALTIESGLDLNYPQIRLWYSHTADRGLNFAFQSFVWNVFYTSVIRNVLTFHRLPNIKFWTLCTNKSLFKNKSMTRTI